MCKVSEKIFIGVGDIHPDGQISDGRTDGRTDGQMDGQTDGRTDGRTEPKLLSPIKEKKLVGDNYGGGA